MGTTAIVTVLTLCLLGCGQVAGRTTKCLGFQDTMTTCMAPIGGGFALQPGGGHELVSDLNATKTLCKEGKLQDAMSCLEEVYNDCAEESRARSELDLMLDVGKWRTGIQRLCDNVDYLQEHDECTKKIAVQSSHCIQSESREFAQKSAAVMAKALQKGRTGQKDLMELGCSFASEVIWCFKNPLEAEESCPCHYRHLIVNVVAESMPPFCKIDTDYYYYSYTNKDCLDDDDDDDVQSEPDPFGGYSIANNDNIRYEYPDMTDNSDTGSSGRNDEEKHRVRIVNQPQLQGKGAEGSEYSVQEVGKSQGHTGTGSAARAFWLLTVAGLVWAMYFRSQ